MATVDSSSTDAQVEAAYDDNSSYQEDDSVTKARAFITAARILLRRYFSSDTEDNTSRSRRIESIENELERARKWLELNDSTRSSTSVTYADFRGFRG